MENINAYFVSKITFTRYLLVILISSISLGVMADGQGPIIVNGSWMNSGGEDYQSLQNPRYTFEVTRAGNFDIRLESNKSNPCIDTVLFLIDANGREKGSNDDWYTPAPQSPHSNCNTNSRIKDIALAKGTYTLVAGTYYRGESGDFVISARSSNGGFKLEQSNPEQTKQVKLTCSDKWISSGGQSFQSRQNPNFDLIVKEKGKVTINLTSSVDTYLYLLSKDDYSLIADNDDIGRRNYNSWISMKLNQGTYVLVAATYGKNQKGNFDLTATSTKDKFKLNCSSEDKGGNSPQQPFSLEDVTIPWSEEGSYQTVVTGGNGSMVGFESSNTAFEVGRFNGRVKDQHPGTTLITGTQWVNNVPHTAQYTLKVVKADQEPLVIDDITKTFAPSLEIKPNFSGGSTDKQVTFDSRYGNTDVVRFIDDNTKIKIEGAGTVVLRATKEGDTDYEPVSTNFVLTVNKAQPWIEIEGITNDKLIKNGTSGEIDIAVNVGIGQGENKKIIDTDAIEFTYANNTRDIFEAVQINNSKIVAKRMGMSTLKVNVEGDENYYAVEKQFELEVRPNEVKFNEKNLSNNSITKPCGQDVDVVLTIDNKTLAETEIQNTGSQDILVFASSDTSVARVNSQNGDVDLVGTGTATISATLFGDPELKDTYELNVNIKGQHWIEFEERGPISIYGDDISNKSVKNQIVDWDNGVITYSIEQEQPFLKVDQSGEVTLDPEKELSDLPSYFKSTIVAKKAGNSCYYPTSNSYKIEFYKSSAFHFPKEGESADKEYIFKWSFPDSESDNKIHLSYVYSRSIIQNFDESVDEKPIAEVDISAGFYKWNTSDLDEGNYYIIARTSKGTDTHILDCDLDGTNGCFLAQTPLRVGHHKIIEVAKRQQELGDNMVKVSLNFDVEENNLKDLTGLTLYIGYDNKKLTFKGIHKDTLGFPESKNGPITEYSMFTDPSSSSLLVRINDYKAGKTGEIKPKAEFEKVTDATRAVLLLWLPISDKFLNGIDEDAKFVDLVSALFERKGGFTSGSTKVDIIQRFGGLNDGTFSQIKNFTIKANSNASTTDDSGE